MRSTRTGCPEPRFHGGCAGDCGGRECWSVAFLGEADYNGAPSSLTRIRMATFGHLAVAALIARLATRPEDSRLRRIRRLAGASAWAVGPDLDLALRLVGVPRGNGLLSHRGASHAVILGPLVTLALIGLDHDPRDSACFGAALASHGIIDMLSDTERGPAAAWPFSRDRFVFPWRPVPSIPLTERTRGFRRQLRGLVRELVLFAPVAAIAFWPAGRRNPNSTAGVPVPRCCQNATRFWAFSAISMTPPVAGVV